MDRSRKRKADASPVVTSASKRQRLPEESPESTTNTGLHFVQSLKASKDKTGRSVATLFLTLPDRRELPDYYQAIRLPIAIDTVEAKLRKHAYPTLTTLESDLKRMIANAKQYNDPKSLVFGDAERIRKLLSNYMREHNPAYRDPDYAAFPTPIPSEDGANVNGAVSSTPEVAPREASERPKKTTITLSRPRKPSPSLVDNAPESTGGNDDFAGKTFQQAQELLINRLIKYTDDDGLEIFSPFVNLPPRSLTDYYRVIKRPVSLISIRKRACGQHGREPSTNITDFKTWAAFEDEVATIWNNAREYNEDGSDMFNLAGEFEEHFLARLAAAKDQIEEPQQPRIKLNARPKTVLHLGSKASPVPAASPGVTVDNDALARQKKLVQAGVNGHQTPQSQQASSMSRSSSQAGLDNAQPSSGKASSPANGVVKTENHAGQTPALTAARMSSVAPEARQSPRQATSMPPPALRVPSGSPFPTQPIPPIVTPVPVYMPAPPTFMDTFARTNSIAEALLPNLNICSHPQLNTSKHYSLDIAPSKEFTQQSLTIMLPPAQYYLQITPTVSPQLFSSRQYKLFVTVNGVRVTPSSKAVMNGDMISVTERKQVYDTVLHAGVNRIEVEIAAVTGRGGALETEKVSVFANLMRN